ncbi:Eco57I restriction-modification methylase domain-containing protein [Vibrio campbellii]|uniref:Eco57I restriction-modification methylase domain-containing protein n=1 Tax=Vibrio campbellii TaxID=680 RepID=UPI00064699A3|nr:methyltransferase [Vibrio campbellii]
MALAEGFINESARRKRLGQYFTGTQLGRVLAALSYGDKAVSIIDPMSGSGDLLAACAELGAAPLSMGALDIDPIALESCRERLPEASCVLGSAFSPTSLKKLPQLQWDLVITNPPYVRYQTNSKSTGKEFPLPGASEVRTTLLSSIDMLPCLDEIDKELFRKMVKGYSGLADLAVPSWILCAGLVAPGGRLALVVPESWLSRNYATVVHYMLLRWFEIEFIVEDEHAVWFPDAQVKTTLLVAKRIPRRDEGLNFSSEASFLKIAISGKASGPKGPCSLLRQGKANPEKSFAEEARKWLQLGDIHNDDMVRAVHVPLARVSSNLQSVCVKQKWYRSLGESSGQTGSSLPHELEEWLKRSSSAHSPVSLASLGVHTGQGLRTGANNFFYGEQLADGLIVFEKLFPLRKWVIPDDIAIPVIRKQADLPSGFVVSEKCTPGRVLDLRQHAMPRDIGFGGELAAEAYDEVPDSVSEMLSATELQNFGKNDETKRIWELSAVAPNVRKGNPEKNIPPRFWYMLPDFARRHRPNLLIARVNTGTPKAYLNEDSRCIIDANFSTLWIDEESNLDEYVLLALLNSAWAAAALELTSSVMGGGALKVEATHLRRLPFPPLEAHTLSELNVLGKELARLASDTQIIPLFERIDILVASASLGRKASDEDVIALRALAETGRSKRGSHRKRYKNQ